MKNAVLLLSTLLFLELILNGFEKLGGRGYLQAVDFAFGERFFYGRNDTIPAPLPLARFDSEIGWIRDFEGVQPGKAVIAVFGDSWTYGLGVKTSDSFPKAMERKLENTQVINYGVPGYGIDQMFLLAERQIEKTKPSSIVIAFIGPDFHRSCFPFYFGKQKAFFGKGFERKLGTLKPPEILLVEHRELKQRFLDGVVVWGFKSRLARLLGAGALKIPIENCMKKLNAEILKRAKKLHPNVHLVHLGERLPFGFEKEMKKSGVPFVSIARKLREGRESGKFILDVSEAHPGPKYHEAIAALLIHELNLNTVKITYQN